MSRAPLRRAGWVLGFTLAAGCGADSIAPVPGPPPPPPPPPPAAPLVLSPAIAAMQTGGTASFTAIGASGAPVGVTWRVDGFPGGTPARGFVAPGGVYSAPPGIPERDSVVVTAVLDADPAVQATATIFFLPDHTSRDYYVALPRVVDAVHPAPVRFLVVPPPAAAAVSFIPNAGAAVPLTPIGAGVLTFTLDPATALTGYVPGRLHNTVGRLDYRTAAGAPVKSASLGINVRDAAMPQVPVSVLADDAQRSPYLLNLRVDTAAIYPYPAIGARALQLLGGDRFDFLAVISSVTSNNNRFYRGVRNDVGGIGTPMFDISAEWGGAGRLRGVIAFPIDDFFDGAGPGLIHEIGHAWINHATDAVLGPGAAHWPPSTMALGVMGVSLPGSGAGGEFPWALTSLGNGTVRVERATPSGEYTALDLYVMGLLPPEEVPAVQVLGAGTNAGELGNGQIIPATTYTIDDYIAAMGPRLPSSATAPNRFDAACVVLTYGRLLTDPEMAFFDAACARAETTVPLASVAGLVMVTAPGFHLATGGRGTLTTRLP